MIILGAISAVLLLVFPFIKNLGSSSNTIDQPVGKITLCDRDASDLCVVSFGKDGADGMVITFQTPKANYPEFYVKGSNKGITNSYQCQADRKIPTIVYCTGISTPLGEVIEIEVYAVDGDILMASGDFMISSMALSLPSSLAVVVNQKIVTPTPTMPAPTEPFPAQTEIVPVFSPTPTPGVAYPNP